MSTICRSAADVATRSSHRHPLSSAPGAVFPRCRGFGLADDVKGSIEKSLLGVSPSLFLKYGSTSISPSPHFPGSAVYIQSVTGFCGSAGQDAGVSSSAGGAARLEEDHATSRVLGETSRNHRSSGSTPPLR